MEVIITKITWSENWNIPIKTEEVKELTEYEMVELGIIE